MIIFWLPGWDFDRHVIRYAPSQMQNHNRLYPLDWFLWVYDEGGSYRLSEWKNHSGIKSVEFIPNLRNPLKYGITVDVDNGAVTYTSPEKTIPKLRNFLIEINITPNAPTATNKIILTIRVHVHDKLKEIWLTPNPFTVHADTDTSILTVLAKFDDDIVGEVTDWTISDKKMPKRLFWVSIKSHPQLQLMPDGNGRILCQKSTDKKIEAIFGVSYIADGTAEAEATVKYSDPWSTPVEVKWISGPGPDKRNDVPNILFLPEGFLDSEREPFEKWVTQFAPSLKKNTIVSPFNVLADSINFWMAFVPSPQAGISVLSEVANLRQEGNHMSARGVPVPESLPESSAATLDEWTLEQLIYKVGLPVKEDREKSLQEKISDWKQIYDSRITEKNIHKGVFSKWNQLSDRTLINECDSAFRMVIGSRLSDQCINLGLQVINFNGTKVWEDRDPDASFYEFLSALTYKNNDIGTLWLGNVNQSNPICIIARCKKGAGTTLIEATHFGQQRTVVVALEGYRNLSVKPVEPNEKGVLNVFPAENLLELSPYFIGVFTHELGHFFHLDDEYGGLYTERCGGGASSIEPKKLGGNLQTRQELIDKDGDSRCLIGNKIKWLWPRINKAGVLQNAPEPVGNGHNIFVITLKPGHLFQEHGDQRISFEMGETVYLRLRPLSELASSTRRFYVDDIIGPNAGGEKLIVKQDEGDQPFHGFFLYPAGSILFVPVVDKAGNQLGLVTEAILQHIDQWGGPLNAPLEEAATRDCQQAYDSDPEGHLDSLHKATNLPDSLKGRNRTQPKLPEKIVGLYEGGKGYPCGFYHPTGLCCMQEGKRIEPWIFPHFLPDPTSWVNGPFCPVCRYLLVELIDPTKHFDIDKEYDKEYPK